MEALELLDQLDSLPLRAAAAEEETVVLQEEEEVVVVVVCGQQKVPDQVDMAVTPALAALASSL